MTVTTSSQIKDIYHRFQHSLLDYNDRCAMAMQSAGIDLDFVRSIDLSCMAKQHSTSACAAKPGRIANPPG
jgi:hypothetical protein